LQGALLEKYEKLPKQDNSSTGKGTEPTFANEVDLKEQHSSYLLKCYKIIKGYFEIKESITSSTDQLAALGLKKEKMLPDGNCFFHAIEHQLKLHNQEKKYYDIRSAAVDYLRTEKTRFDDFIDKHEYPTYEIYIKQMSDDRNYADYLTLSAIAIIVKKNIIVHERGQKPLMIPGYVPHGNQLHVWYDPISQHYDSVVSSDDTQPRVLLPEEFIEL
jgi:hypothetical protein